MNNVKLYDGKQVSIDVLKKLEVRFGIEFPESYVKLILKNNGAYASQARFNISGRVESINDFHDVEEEYHFSDDRLPPGVIPFARDAGDNQICFDYRVKGKVSIVFWDYEIEQIEKGALSPIADSFDEFLEMLYENEE